MIRTIIILIATLIVLPLVVLKLDPHPISPEQWHMIEVSGLMALATALSCFMLAEITGNCSQVDKLWSIMPMIYTWYFAYASDWSPRVVLMMICATIWGVRLTYNFSRRGAYRLKFWEGEEDYRWEVLRQNPLFKGKPINWKLFNLFFISIYQNALIWLFSLPPVMAFAGRERALGVFDYLLAAVIVGLVVIETIADQQQWNYQNEKHRRLNAGEKVDGEYAIGFIRTGLWSYVRHPNYAAEQAIWVMFYLFSIVATGYYINWSMAGCLLLLVLFQGSADFSEGISLSKYPAYADRIKLVPRFIPNLWQTKKA
jgi:steroid 5-alpha reductase family enzyme